MYDDIKRERQFRMQALAGQGSAGSLSQQSRNVAIVSILLFALAGLISGFSVGAFVRPHLSLPANNTNTATTPLTTGHAQTPTHTPQTQHPIALGEPVIDQFVYSEVADGATNYTFVVHAVDHQNQPVHTSSVTCKIWLTQDSNVNKNISISRLRAVDTISQPFPGEMQGALNFASSTPQTQICNNGQGTWNYTLSSSLEHGIYYLVILMDSSGAHFNWKWVAIVIKK